MYWFYDNVSVFFFFVCDHYFRRNPVPKVSSSNFIDQKLHLVDTLESHFSKFSKVFFPNVQKNYRKIDKIGQIWHTLDFHETDI